MILRGIDVSRHQGLIDWPRVAPHVDEVLIRATMGAIGVDDAYARNWRESGWAGIRRRGIYHLATSETLWRGQRENILRTTGGDLGNIPLTLDCERTARDRQRMEEGWRFPRQLYTDDVLELGVRLLADGAVGVRIYSNKTEIEAMTTQPPALALFGFHGAGYPLRTPMTFERLLALQATYRLAIPLPWREAEAWQGASTGQLPGIAGYVDMSLIYGEALPPVTVTPGLAQVDALRALINGA